MTDHTTMHHIAARNPEQAWWDQCSFLGQLFFNSVRINNFNAPTEHLLALLAAIADEQEAIEHADNTPYTHDAHACLLSAMSDMSSALATCLDGDERQAMAYLDSARIELAFMYLALDDLDVTYAINPFVTR